MNYIVFADSSFQTQSPTTTSIITTTSPSTASKLTTVPVSAGDLDYSAMLFVLSFYMFGREKSHDMDTLKLTTVDLASSYTGFLLLLHPILIVVW